MDPYLIFVTDAPTVSVVKNWSCGEISNFYTSVMGRNLEFLHMWFDFKQMWRNLKSPSLCVQFMVSCCILHSFVAKFDSFFFGNLRCFVAKLVSAIHALLCGEKIVQHKASGYIRHIWLLKGIKKNTETNLLKGSSIIHCTLAH